MVAKKEPEQSCGEAANGLSFESDTLVVRNQGGDGSTSRGDARRRPFPAKERSLK